MCSTSKNPYILALMINRQFVRAMISQKKQNRKVYLEFKDSLIHCQCLLVALSLSLLNSYLNRSTNAPQVVPGLLVPCPTQPFFFIYSFLFRTVAIRINIPSSSSSSSLQPMVTPCLRVLNISWFTNFPKNSNKPNNHLVTWSDCHVRP